MSSKENNSHENYNRVETTLVGSEKNFGLTFAVIFMLLALAPLIRQHPPRWWAVALSLLFLTLALISPKLLKIPNLYWFKFGMLLHTILSPIILALLFFAVFTPLGLVLRLFRKDILNIKIKKSLASYWIKSDASITSMKDQF